VPYRGAAPAMQGHDGGTDPADVRPGRHLTAAGARPQLSSPTPSRRRTRLPSAPDLPSVDEAGLPGFHIAVWTALWAPRATPKAIIEKLNAAAVDALADPGRAQTARRRTRPGHPAARAADAEALYAYQKAEIEKWWPLIKSANIRPE